MQVITFTKDSQTLEGYEVSWVSLPRAVKSMGGDVDDRYEGTKFIEIGTFSGIFLEDDFEYERFFALSNNTILSASELEEKGFDWS